MEQQIKDLLAKDGEMTIKSIAARLETCPTVVMAVMVHMVAKGEVKMEKEDGFRYYSLNQATQEA